MPILSMFYGVSGASRRLLDSGPSLLDGEIPASKRKLVEVWIEIHRDELMADWGLAVAGEPVFKIKGLE